jgi:hypothetical protein
MRAAFAMVQKVFELFLYKHSKKPMLVKRKKEVVTHWGLLTTAGTIPNEYDSSGLV